MFNQTEANSNASLYPYMTKGTSTQMTSGGGAVALVRGMFTLHYLDTFEALEISKLNPRKKVFINSKHKNEHTCTVLSLIQA